MYSVIYIIDLLEVICNHFFVVPICSIVLLSNGFILFLVYESEMAPEGYKETAKMHPRVTPMVSEKHVMQSSVNQSSEQEKQKSPSSNQIVAESVITKLPNEIFTGIVLTKPLINSNETATGTTATKPHSPNKTVTEATATKPHSPNNAVTETGDTKTPSPKKTITETVTEKLGAGYATVSEKLGTGYATVSEKLGTGYTTASDKLGPAYATVSDATQAIASKIESLTVSPPVPTISRRENLTASPPVPTKIEGLTVTAPPPSQSITAREAPQPLSASAIPHKSSSRGAPESPQPSSAPAGPGKTAGAGQQKWDKGVSVKEYLIQKFEPGEDERALSQVISDAMSPRKTPGEAGMVEKVKGAITSLLRNEESPKTTTSQSAITSSQSTTFSSPRIPISTNAYEGNFLVLSFIIFYANCKL